MLLADDVIQAYDELSESMRQTLDPLIPQPDWDSYVAHHRIAKEQEKQVLGGTRPEGVNRRPTPFAAQVDEVGSTATTRAALQSASNLGIGVAQDGPASYANGDITKTRAVTALEVDDRDAVLVSSPEQDDDDDDDDEWGSFASTSEADPQLSFDDTDGTDAFAFTPGPSISERVLTIADLNSSFHADVEANGSMTAFEDWPPDQEDGDEPQGGQAVLESP